MKIFIDYVLIRDKLPIKYDQIRIQQTHSYETRCAKAHDEKGSCYDGKILEPCLRRVCIHDLSSECEKRFLVFDYLNDSEITTGYEALHHVLIENSF